MRTQKENYAALTQGTLDPIRRSFERSKELEERIQNGKTQITFVFGKEVKVMSVTAAERGVAVPQAEQFVQGLEATPKALVEQPGNPNVLTVTNGHGDLMHDDWAEWTFANPAQYDQATHDVFQGKRTMEEVRNEHSTDQVVSERPAEHVVYQTPDLVSEWYANK